MIIRSHPAKHQKMSSRPALLRRLFSLILVFALIGSLFAGIVSAAEDTVSNLKITSDAPTSNPIHLTVEDGTVQLTATASVSGTVIDVTQDAVWTSSNSLIKVSKGVLSATGAVSSATITVKYRTETQYVTVKSDYAYDEIKLKIGSSSSDAPDALDIDLGSELNLTAWAVNGATSDNMTTEAQWTTSNTAVATVSKGSVKVLAAGTATITVKSKGRSDSIVLTVNSPYKSIEIYNTSNGSIVKEPIEFVVGDDDVVLEAEAILNDPVLPNVDITQDATWSSSSNSVVKVDKGIVEAVGAGKATVTVNRYGVSSSVTFIVSTPYEFLQVTPDKAISVTMYAPNVPVSAKVTKGTLIAVDVTAVSATEWKIEDLSVAGIVRSGSNVYVEPKNVGSTKLNVIHKGLSKSIAIHVYPTIDKVEIAKESLDVFVEDSIALPSVSGKTMNGDTKEISGLVQWTTSAPDVVVQEDGKWKALKQGKATLTAKVENEAGIYRMATLEINVHNKVLAIIPSVDTISVVTGREVNLPAVQLIYEDGEEETISDKIEWKSSTPNLLVKATTMKGLLPAAATLTGTYLDKTIKVKVTVEEEFTKFIVEPTKISLTLKKSQTIKVTGITKSGKKVNLGSRIDWQPSSDEHVTIKGSSVRSIAEGSGKLTAEVQGNKLEIPYVVVAKLSKLTASSTSYKATIGQQINVNLTALYENGKTENVTSKATWVTNKAAVATVEDGKIKVNGKGSASIKATFGGKSVTIRITAK